MPVSPSLAPAQQHIIRNELKLQFIWELFAITPHIQVYPYRYIHILQLQLQEEHCVIYTICFSPNHVFQIKLLWDSENFLFFVFLFLFLLLSYFIFTLYHDGSFRVDHKHKPLYFTQYHHRIAIFYWYLCDLDEHFIKHHEFKTTIKCFKLCTSTYVYSCER